MKSSAIFAIPYPLLFTTRPPQATGSMIDGMLPVCFSGVPGGKILSVFRCCQRWFAVVNSIPDPPSESKSAGRASGETGFRFCFATGNFYRLPNSIFYLSLSLIAIFS